MVINTHLEHASLQSRKALEFSVFITKETFNKRGSANASLTFPSTVKITRLIF